MAKERSGGLFGNLPGFRRLGASSGAASATASPATPQIRKPSNTGLGGKGLGKAYRRHQKVLRDNIHGVTKGDIRRLARRGGVKRLSATVYDDIRQALKQRLEDILKKCVMLVEHSGRKTVCVTDVIFTLNQMGRPLYGLDPSFHGVR